MWTIFGQNLDKPLSGLITSHLSLAVFLSPNPRIYELYTSATGIYLCLLAIKLSTLTTGWIQQGWAQLSQKVREWTIIVSYFHTKSHQLQEILFLHTHSVEDRQI